MNFPQKASRGIVFKVRKYSIHDGPGIRTVVFLKGCPLRCHWCDKPESQEIMPELAYNRDKCLSISQCGRCIEFCAVGAMTIDHENRIVVDRDICINCVQCTDTCPSGALSVYGRVMTVDEVVGGVEADSIFYSRSGGGMTLSGGEPLLQPAFTIALLREAKRRKISTALETSGHCDFNHLESACNHLNYLLYDIRHLDSAKHRRFVSVPNDTILNNLRWIRERFPQLPICVRTPVIPGFNDTEAEIGAIADHIRDIPNLCYELLLPGHRFSKPGDEYSGRHHFMGDAAADEEKMEALNKIAGAVRCSA